MKASISIDIPSDCTDWATQEVLEVIRSCLWFMGWAIIGWHREDVFFPSHMSGLVVSFEFPDDLESIGFHAKSSLLQSKFSRRMVASLGRVSISRVAVEFGGSDDPKCVGIRRMTIRKKAQDLK